MKNTSYLIRNPTIPKNQGFTIIETLLGITITGMVFATTAPIIMLAIGTRIQAYQAEQAMQIAQGEINHIQVLMSQGVPPGDEAVKLPPAVSQGVQLSQVVAPSIAVAQYNNDTYSKAFELDLDNDSNTKSDQFLVQTFRDPGMRFNEGSADGQLAVFRVGVRVYSRLAKDQLGSLETDVISFHNTQDFGQQRTRPLAVVYTEVSRSDLKSSLKRYQDYLNAQ